MDEYDNDISPDDELESTRTNPLNAHVGTDALPEDHDTPAAPPSSGVLPPDHPSHDTNLDSNEIYQEGE